MRFSFRSCLCFTIALTSVGAFFIAKNQKKVLTNKWGGFIMKIPHGGMRIKGKRYVMEYCEHCKMKHRTPDEAKALINRLNRIEGQVRGVKGMVENDTYCTDILVQVSAITAALNAFNKELMASHIRTCVAEDIRRGDDSTIEELVSTLQKLMK